MKSLIAGLFALLTAAAAFAGTEINKADAAELQTVRGIGASTATKILEERKKGNFKDWGDLIERLQGVGPKNAAKLSAEGLTVNGAAYSAPAEAVAEKPAKPKKAEKAEKAEKPEKT